MRLAPASFAPFDATTLIQVALVERDGVDYTRSAWRRTCFWLSTEVMVMGIVPG
jgi:hypothetical protein